jgi:hypothetical protein
MHLRAQPAERRRDGLERAGRRREAALGVVAQVRLQQRQAWKNDGLSFGG